MYLLVMMNKNIVDWYVIMAYNHGMKSAKKNFHVPLSDKTYYQLKAVSKDLKRPSTQIVRELIDYWLREREKNLLHESIVTYASQEAGGPADLDLELEASGIDSLFKDDGAS